MLRPSAAALAAAAALFAPSPARAQVTLTTSDLIGTSSFNTNLHWSDGQPPSAASTYTVGILSGAALTLRTPNDAAVDVTFGGAGLTLAGTTALNPQLLIKSTTNRTVTVNNLTLDGGTVVNGGTQAGANTTVTLAGGVALGASGGSFNAGVAGRVIIVSAPVTGAGPLAATSTGGRIDLTGANTNTGTTTLGGTTVDATSALSGSVRAADGVGLSAAANLTMNGGLLETSGTFARPVGTAAGAAQVTGGVSGFSAVGGDLTVSLGGAGAPATLTWGSATFNPSILALNNANATGALTVANPIALGTAARTVFTTAGTATLAGGVSGSGALNAYGAGTLVLSTANPSYTGTTNIGSGTASATSALSGVVRATASGALGTGAVSPGPGGNGTTGRLELAGGITLANAVALNGRNNATASVVNVAGNNTMTGTFTIQTGGGTYLIQSDAGRLTLSGAGGGGVAVTSAATGTRAVTLGGAGDGVVSGVIQNGSAVPVSVAKTGAGTWTLSGANTYTGATTFAGGTLALGAANRIADTSPAAFGGGTFATAGFSETVGAASMTASSTVDLGAGASVLRFADSSTQTWAGTLTIVNWSGDPLLGGGTDQVYFGTTAAVLTAAQLAQIQFTGYVPGAVILATGEVVPAPVPEPAGLVAAGLAAAAWLRRRGRVSALQCGRGKL